MTLIQSPGWRWLHSGESRVSFLIPSQPGSRGPAPGHNGVCCGAAAANRRPGHAASANQEAGPSRDPAPGRGLDGGQTPAPASGGFLKKEKYYIVKTKRRDFGYY